MDHWLQIHGCNVYAQPLTNSPARRHHKEREAIFLADQGQAPPMYVRGGGYPWGPLHATEGLGPGAALQRWKVSHPRYAFCNKHGLKADNNMFI